MADRIVKPDSGNDLVLQNDDASAKVEVNEDGTVVVTPSVQVDNIKIDGNTITSENTNGNVDITPNGTGEVNISKVDIDSGTIDGTDVTVGAGKTLDVSAGTLTSSTAQKQAIVQAGPGSGTLDVSSGTLTTSTAQKQAIVSGGGTTEAKGLVPVGSIFQMAFTPGSTWLSTNKFLICDGSSLNSTSDTEYADLYSAIGTTWGGSSASAFNIPDLKGAYLRGVGTSTVFTQNQTITLAQTINDQFQGHNHDLKGWNTNTASGNNNVIFGNGTANYVSPNSGGVGGPTSDASSSGTPRTGNETRPNSRGVQFIIKF